MSIDRRFGYGAYPTTTLPPGGPATSGAQDFYSALAQAVRDVRPVAATQPAYPTPQPQAQTATANQSPAPDPTNEDPAYQLLNRGGSLKLQQLADYAKNNPVNDPFNGYKSGGYGIATAPALTVPPGFNGGFVPLNGNGTPGQGQTGAKSANDIYGFIVPVGSVDANGRPLDATGTTTQNPAGYGMFVPIGTIQDGQPVPGFGNGINYNGFGAPTFETFPLGYDSVNPALLFDPLSGALLNRVL